MAEATREEKVERFLKQTALQRLRQAGGRGLGDMIMVSSLVKLAADQGATVTPKTAKDALSSLEDEGLVEHKARRWIIRGA